MPTQAPTNIIELAHQVGIVNLDQMRECWDDLGTRGAPIEEVVRHMQRKGYLTPFLIDKLQKRETTGYFYGLNKVLYKVASGGFARVYRGINTQTGETVAVKVLRQRWTSDKASIEAFYHEGKVGQMLRHPNIVRIDEVGGHEKVHYIVMEFIEGGNLRDFLHIRGGRVERTEAIRLMLDAVSGLAYAFDQGVTHRDIKLTNLLASTQGVIKLVDFGLAAVHKDEARAEEAHGQRTVEYAVLEKTTNVKKGDTRSDIFFLGAVFYQMIAGSPPIPDKKDRASRLLRTRIDNIRPVRDIYQQVDPQLAAIVDRMMSLDVHARYQTPHEVIDALKAVANTPAIVGTAKSGKKSQATASGKHEPTVLFIEADAGLQDTVRRKLHDAGYRVMITTDPHRAVDRYRENQADCVIVDCETTDKAGLNAFLEMAKFSRVRKLPWSGILLLKQAQSEWALEVNTDQKTAVLIKPITMRQLREEVQRILPISQSPAAKPRRESAL